MTGHISDLAVDSSPNAGKYLVELDTADTSMAPAGTDKRATIAAVGKVVTGWNDLVRDFGADPTGGTAITTPLSNACSAAVSAQPASYGLTVPPGKYLVAAHQDLPWNMTLKGAGNEGGDVTGQFTGTLFTVSSSFSTTGGSYVFGLKDNPAPPSVPPPTGVNSAILMNFAIDGASFTASAVDGIHIVGPTTGTLRDILIAQMSGWAVSTASDTSGPAEITPFAQSWRGVTADSCGVVGGGGFQLIGCEDSVFAECYSIGNGSGPGFYIDACDNSKWIGCNAEWNATNGFYVTGDWQYFAGPCQMIGCSTDANSNYGLYIDATWTTGGGAGTGPGILLVNGLANRRDGQGTAAGSGVYAGIGFSSGTTMPVIINGFAQMTQIGDGGSGTMSPNFGIYFAGTSYSQPILIANGLAWGYTSAYRTTTTSNAFPTGVTSSNVLKAHGNAYSPSYS